MTRTSYYCWLGACFVGCVLLTANASAELIFEDTFDIGGDSANTGFGADGVNTNVPTRWNGRPSIINTANLGWYNFSTKAATAYSIESDAMDVLVAGNAGRVALSTDQGNPGSVYNFASDLGVGSGAALYTLEVSMGIDVDATNGARTSFMWGDNVSVNDSDIGLQLRDSGADLEVFIRIDGGSNSGGDINQLIGTFTGGAGQIVDFAIDFVDNGNGNQSDFVLTATSGGDSFTVTDTDVVVDNSWAINGIRTFAMDTAPNEGAIYDNVRITLVPEPSSAVLSILAVGSLLYVGKRLAD